MTSHRLRKLRQASVSADTGHAVDNTPGLVLIEPGRPNSDTCDGAARAGTQPAMLAGTQPAMRQAGADDLVQTIQKKRREMMCGLSACCLTRQGERQACKASKHGMLRSTSPPNSVTRAPEEDFGHASYTPSMQE
eukprot:4053176-Pleurochrysis_carterae.AAC.1